MGSVSIETLLAHADDLHKLARALAHDQASADELVQETWVSMLESPEREVEAVRPWLLGALRNVARARHRADVRRERRDRAVARPEAAEDEENIYERLEAFSFLASEVARLKEPYRSTIFARFFEGRSPQEIAAAAGISPATVRSRQLRGLEMLRARLDKQYGGRSAWCFVLLGRGFERQAAPVATASTLVGPLSLGALFVVLTLGVGAWMVSQHETPGEILTGAVPATAAPDVALARTGDEAARVLAADPRVDAEPLELAASEAPSAFAGAAPVALRLIDARTRKPLEDYAVSIAGQAPITSDAFGRLRSAEKVAAADFNLHLIDREELRKLREQPSGRARAFRFVELCSHPGDAEREVSVSVGPTFELALPLPLAAADELVWIELQALDTLNSNPAARAPLRVRPSGSQWVRFLPQASAGLGARPWKLVARPTRSAWIAEARADAGVDDVRFELGPAAALEVAIVRASDGTALAGARYELRDEHGTLLLQGAQTGADAGAKQWVRAGNATLRAQAFALQPRELALELQPGESQRARVTLDDLTARATLSGVLELDGEPPWVEPVTLTLRHVESRTERELVLPTARAETRALPFELAQLPEGLYELTARSNEVYAWSGAPAQVRVPSAPLALRPRRFESTQDVWIRPADAQGGARIDAFEAELVLSAPLACVTTRTTHFSALAFTRLPSSARFTWRVRAEGYKERSGDERELVREGTRMVLRPALEPER